MAIRKVPAGNGVTWITEAIQLILKNPGPFVLMGLVIAVAGVIPILGALALAILGPALYGGIAWAAREQSRGGKAVFEHLFQAFQQEGKIGPMLLLCLPGVIGGVVSAILLVILISSIGFAGAGISAATDSSAALWASRGMGGLLALVFIMALAIPVFALTLFAIPDLMFKHNDAIGAMKQSVRASVDNIGALLLYLLILIVAMFLIKVLSVISVFLAQFLVFIALAPIVGTSMYLAWKDVYGDSTIELPAVGADSQDGGGIVA